MDNIIVNSALWYAEQSSQFLLNSGANKLLDKGYDYYVKEVIPLGHRLIQNGQIAADAMDGELAAQFSMAYVANYWRAAKTVYNFAPEFLRTLAVTEDAPIYSDIMMRLPYRDFVMNLPAGSHHDAMFVHIEFDASHGPNDVDTLFLIVPFKANPNFDNIELCQCMQWCLNGKKLIESYRRNNDAREQAFQNGTDSATVNDATISNVPGAVLSEEELEKQLASGTEYQRSTATGTGRTVRPHVRRAHWHHYWVGEGRTRLEVRWIEPTFVLPEGKREIKIATVRRVMGT